MKPYSSRSPGKSVSCQGPERESMGNGLLLNFKEVERKQKHKNASGTDLDQSSGACVKQIPFILVTVDVSLQHNISSSTPRFTYFDLLNKATPRLGAVMLDDVMLNRASFMVTQYPT